MTQHLRLKNQVSIISPWQPFIFFLKMLCMESTHDRDSLSSPFLSFFFRIFLFFILEMFFMPPDESSHFRVAHSYFHLSVLLSYSYKRYPREALGENYFKFGLESRTSDDAVAHILLLGWSVRFSYVFVYINAHMHTHTDTHIHTFIHTYMHIMDSVLDKRLVCYAWFFSAADSPNLVVECKVTLQQHCVFGCN